MEFNMAVAGRGVEGGQGDAAPFRGAGAGEAAKSLEAMSGLPGYMAS
eukprot:gene5517-989_t